ncbi:hypothetical protein BV20DRAFT_971494 [Pilatotrama ljubarskyi]|nr:hypothetical protein BV20DRAFT_971494 [Pilatotrama ljubarskyi]
MNPNLQNTPTAAAQLADPEKALYPEPVNQSLTGPPSYNAVYQPPTWMPRQGRERNVRRRRFWHFTACAVLLFMFGRPLVSHVASFVAKFTDKDVIRVPMHDPSWAHPPTADPSDCADTVNWTLDSSRGHGDWPYHAHTSLAFPIDAEELFFRAEGPLAHGTFEVSHSKDVGRDAIIDVDVSYRVQDALSEATVCHLRPSDDRHGLGIFTRRWDYPHDHEYQLRFNIHVRLPATGNSEALTINGLSTHLPQFSHHLRQLADTAVFKSIHLSTTNAGMRADSLLADVAGLRSTNGRIEGTFNTTTSLDLYTSNGPIVVRANLLNDDEDAGTTATLRTSNAVIQAQVGLYASSHDATGGAFRVDTRTSNGPITLSFVDQPANSQLNASAVSSNSPVRASVHPGFEGTFELHSSWFAPPSVEQNGPVRDPLGRDRRRDVQVNTIRKGAIRGQIDWQPKHKDAKSGHIGLETSNAHAILAV